MARTHLIQVVGRAGRAREEVHGGVVVHEHGRVRAGRGGGHVGGGGGEGTLLGCVCDDDVCVMDEGGSEKEKVMRAWHGTQTEGMAQSVNGTMAVPRSR